MKLLSVLFIILFLASQSFSQTPKVSWGDEFKMSKGSTDLAVVYADNTGVYLQESHAVLTSYFVIGATTRGSATLVKLSTGLAEQYRNDFNKELRGKEFVQFFAVQDRLYILSSDYSRRDKTLTLFAAQVDKGTGELNGEWQELANWQKEEKSDNIRFKVSTNADNTSMILVSSVEGTGKNSYQVQEFDKTLKPLGKPLSVGNEFDPKTFQLEDVLYTSAKKIVLVGRIYEYEEGKRKKDKFLDFVHYNIRIYGNNGKQQTEINTDINGKWLVSTKVLQEPDKDLVVAAFYSNEKKGKDINGLLVQRIDPNTGNVITTSQKEINTSLISAAADDNAATADDDKDEDSRKERKEREKFDKIKDESEGFSRYLKFRNIFYTPDNGLVILAEKYHDYTYTTTQYNGGGFGGGTWTTSTYTVFESEDLMMCKIDAAGNINWLNVLPKEQREVIGGSYTSYGGFGVGSYYFSSTDRPFYSGFGALQSNNSINIIFNDHSGNAGVLQLGQGVKRESYFRHSDCFNVELDAATGKYTRKVLFSNNDVPTAMPRLGNNLGKDLYIIGREDRMFGRTKVAVAKITAGS